MRGLVWVVGVSGCAACAGAAEGGGAAVMRDSAGIRIVENSGPIWQAGRGWRVVDSPLVDIGGRGSDPRYEFDQLRGPVRLSDGRLAIANSASNEVRLYDASGKHLRSSGRGGSGPGEYRTIVGIWLGPGDSLLVSDVLIRRLTVLDRDGNVGRSFSLGGQVGALAPTNGKMDVAIPSGWLADGSVVGISQTFTINQPRSGIYRDTVTVTRYGADGATRDTLGRFPGTEMKQMTLTLGSQTFSTPSPVPLGKQTITLATGTGFYVAQNNAWQIEARGLDGKLHALVRVAIQPAAIRPSDIASHRRQQLDAMAAQPALRNVPEALKTQLKMRIEQAEYPATFPFFAALLGDQDGNVWAQEVTPATQKEERYAVVDSAGRFLGRVVMPPHFHPTFIAPDAVYGVWKDADEVEHIRSYRVRKG